MENIQGKVAGTISPNGAEVNRVFTQSYKLKILQQVADCTTSDQLNTLLHREKLHKAQLSKWQREFRALVEEKNQALSETAETANEKSLNQSELSLNDVAKKITPPESNTIASRSPKKRQFTRTVSTADNLIDPGEIIAKIWRKKWMVAATMITILFLTLVFLSNVTPKYTSRALIMIDNQGLNITTPSVVSNIPGDLAAVMGELEILQSDKLINQIIDKYQLQNQTEFNPNLKKPGFISRFLLSITGNTNKPSGYDLPEDNALEISPERNSIIKRYRKLVKLAILGESRLIEIKVRTSDPVISAGIANSLIDFYIKDQLQAKSKVTNKANDWLNNRVEELQQKVSNAEKAVEDFRSNSGLLESVKGVTLYSQQISQVNTQLIQSSLLLAEKEARLQQVRRLVKSGNIDSASEVMGSVLIQRLREKESDLERRITDLSIDFGDKHPKIVNLNKETIELNAKIDSEVKKIVSSLRNEVAIERSREQKLKNQLVDLEANVTSSNESEIGLRALEREAEANRNLLATFLGRYKETSTQTDADLQRANVRVISRASIPEKPSFPQTVPILSLALFASLILGLLMVYISELLERGFRSTVQIERATQLPSLGMVPQHGKLLSRVIAPEAYVLKQPASALGEAIRSLSSNMMFLNNNTAPKTILFTSSLPKEGKSTSASCMAMLQAMAGKKVIIIDADIRKPRINKAFNLPVGPGLADYLEGHSELHDVIKSHKKSGAYVISAGSTKASATDLLNSDRMDHLLTELKGVFDMVIIDSPPVMAVSDARILATKVDMTAFIIQWTSTRREVVQYNLNQLIASGVNNIGTVLTKVDTKKHADYAFADSGMYSGILKSYYVG